MQNFAGTAADQNLIRLQLFARGNGGAKLLGVFVMIAARASEHLGHGVDRKLWRSIGILVGVQQYKPAQIPAPRAPLPLGTFTSHPHPTASHSHPTPNLPPPQ